jgi:hypothetical protein
MVEQSSLIIAVTDGRLGGTMNTVNYARKLNKEIVILKPQLFAFLICFPCLPVNSFKSVLALSRL